MTTATLGSFPFPLLLTTYSRPLLLEAQVKATALDGVISARDTAELRLLKDRKGAKLAKRWAPLVVHNLLMGAAVEDEGLQAALKKAEGHLQGASACSWASTFRQAGEIGVPPTAFVRSLSKDMQKRLIVDLKVWRAATERVESELSTWMLGAVEKLEACYKSMDESSSSVSLKKMAKFVPRAA